MGKYSTHKKNTSKETTSLLHQEVRGQAGAVFRLMVDAIIGLVILMMIVFVINYFDNLRYQTSLENYYTTVNAAVQTPNGKVVTSPTLVFKQGTGLSTETLQNTNGYSAKCFHYETNLSFTQLSEPVDDAKTILFTQNSEAKVYVQCVPNPNLPELSCGESVADCCEVLCTISIGKKLTES